jgi:hypothetical protein
MVTDGHLRGHQFCRVGLLNAKKRPLLVGCLLLGSAISLFFTVGFGQPRTRTLPVSFDLPATGQWIQSKPFYAGVAGNFRASLLLERKLPFRELECLADVGMPYPHSTASGRRTDCPVGFSPTVLEWAVIERGKPVQLNYSFGDHAGRYSAADVGRDLGVLELRYFTSYVARARIVGGSQALAATRPKFQLAFEGSPFPEDYLIQTALVSLVAIGLGLTGTAKLAREALRATRGKGTDFPAV